MVELTHGGTWLNWSTLNRRDRNWAILSFATSFLAALPIGLISGEWGYRFGHRTALCRACCRPKVPRLLQ